MDKQELVDFMKKQKNSSYSVKKDLFEINRGYYTHYEKINYKVDATYG